MDKNKLDRANEITAKVEELRRAYRGWADINAAYLGDAEKAGWLPLVPDRVRPTAAKFAMEIYFGIEEEITALEKEFAEL